MPTLVQETLPDDITKSVFFGFRLNPDDGGLVVEKIDDNTMTIQIPDDTEIIDKYDYKHWIWSSHTLKFSWNNSGHLLLEVI